MEQGSQPPPVAEVARAVPNPAGHVVQLSINPNSGGPVVITDVSGRVVRRLVCPTGANFVLWNCCDDQGRAVPAGTYLYSCGNIRGRFIVAE